MEDEGFLRQGRGAPPEAVRGFLGEAATEGLRVSGGIAGSQSAGVASLSGDLGGAGVVVVMMKVMIMVIV